MAKVIGYVRVSTDHQTNENQRLAILDYSNKHGLKVDEWVEVQVSSRRSIKDRKIDQLLAQVRPGDTVIVSELSRLARSVGQIAILVDELIKNKVSIRCIKESIEINGNQDMRTKVLITMFSLLAEIERDLISERTKEGLRRARASGKRLGRPKGPGKSKLDGKEDEIRGYLAKGVNVTNVARIVGVGRSTLVNFIKSRELVA